MQTTSPLNWILCPVFGDTESKHGLHRGFLLERSWVEPCTSEAATPFNGSNKADIECRLQAMAANWSALRGFWFARLPWNHRRLIFPVSNREHVDHGPRCMRSITR